MAVPQEPRMSEGAHLCRVLERLCKSLGLKAVTFTFFFFNSRKHKIKYMTPEQRGHCLAF
jgi:hypothetical protein